VGDGTSISRGSVHCEFVMLHSEQVSKNGYMLKLSPSYNEAVPSLDVFCTVMAPATED